MRFDEKLNMCSHVGKGWKFHKIKSNGVEKKLWNVIIGVCVNSKVFLVYA